MGAAAKLQIADAKPARATEVKTASDIAFEAKRVEAAKATEMREMAVWISHGGGKYLEADRNSRITGNTPTFKNLDLEHQLAWARAIFNLEESRKNDAETIDTAFSEIAPNASGATEYNGVVQVDDRGAGADSQYAETSGGRGNNPPTTTVVKKKRSSLPPGKATPALEDDSRTIDGTDLVREISETEMLMLESSVDRLPDTQRRALERAYGNDWCPFGLYWEERRSPV